jgi:hypothetical protein
MARKNVASGTVLNTRKNLRDSLNEESPQSTWQSFHDFNELAIVEADSPFIFNAGSDAAAIDPAISVAERGVLRVTAGPGDGTAAVDGSQVCLVVPVQADSGGLAFECRLKITDITKCSVFVGFTDVTTLEEPMSVSVATLTTNCSNGVGFVFDTAMTTDTWWAAGVDGDTDATGSGALDLVSTPVDDTYQVLRCEVAADGESADFYVDGVLAHSLTASVCAASTNMYFTVFANGDGSNAAAATVDVDYILVSHTR